MSADDHDLGELLMRIWDRFRRPFRASLAGKKGAEIRSANREKAMRQALAERIEARKALGSKVPI